MTMVWNRFLTLVPLIVITTFTLPRDACADQPFDQGTWNLQLYGSYSDTFRLGLEQTAAVNGAIGWYVRDGLSINVELVGYRFETEGEHIEALGADVLFRLHLLTRDRFSLFLDAAGGGLYADDQVPLGGTHYNWLARLGGGLSYELWEDVHLVGGVRYFHLSNGDRHGRPRNPSVDAVETFVGVMWTF